MPQTTATTVEIFQTPNGKTWHLAGTDSNGIRYFVPSHLDPAKVLRLAWAKETDLTDALGPLIPAQRTAA